QDAPGAGPVQRSVATGPGAPGDGHRLGGLYQRLPAPAVAGDDHPAVQSVDGGGPPTRRTGARQHLQGAHQVPVWETQSARTRLLHRGAAQPCALVCEYRVRGLAGDVAAGRFSRHGHGDPRLPQRQRSKPGADRLRRLNHLGRGTGPARGAKRPRQLRQGRPGAIEKGEQLCDSLWLSGMWRVRISARWRRSWSSVAWWYGMSRRGNLSGGNSNPRAPRGSTTWGGPMGVDQGQNKPLMVPKLAVPWRALRAVSA